ncbi:DNA polymerase III subunit delta' [Ramlibacter alkalitolerans]|uniref:DNA polymerase III subunit delta n=1 Tax=Ramlibacter alkalitolerans TaxID=2039631 RepID=A0ABS1JTZ1_9BURK|nr:DNA polymerase III subunit delta' [Ramlibacter alkalitolerans]MBL0427601.1 DNA polymerase III subunit delta' [Ramlibacter alkalitolerans]
MTAPWIRAQLRHLLAQRGHAWLLQGPSGLGQYKLALELAAAWLCDRPTPDGACGQCHSCHQVQVRSHTDLAVLMPETEMLAREWPLAEKAQAEIDDKKRKPSREIRVEAMRDAVEFAQRTSGRGRGKVVMVYPADRMNAVTANALLKTLEEPPGDVRFVLATEAAHLLLPTIRSRCLGHGLAWPGPDEATAWLAEQGVPAPAAPVLLRAAGGRPEDALRLHQAGLDARAWSQWPKALVRGDNPVIGDWGPGDLVEALQKLCHDLLAVRSGAAPRFFEAADLPPAASVQALTGWWRALAATSRTVDHPFNAGLMLEDLVSQARAALHSRSPS